MDAVPFLFCESVLSRFPEEDVTEDLLQNLPKIWRGAAEACSKIVHYAIRIEDKPDGQYVYEIYDFNMLAWLDLSDLLIKDLRYVQISSIAFQPFEEGENTTPISKDDLIQKLIPIVCSLMPDPSFLSVGKETHLDVLKPFLSLSKTKNLNFSYFGELSLKVLSKKLKTNPVKDLVLDGNWPDQVQDILIPRLLSGSLSKLRFTSTISINYVEAAFTKWKDTEGVAEFELGGRQSHDFCHYVLECSRRCEIYQYLQDPLQNKDQKEMLFVKGDRKLKCSFFEDPANPRFSLLTL